MKQIITHFTDNDLYTFSCQYYIMQQYPRAEVEYTFYDRNKTCYPQGFDKLLQEQVVYSNGLDVDRCIAIHEYCKGRVKDSYGVGTQITCDVNNAQPSNIVIKLTKCRITEMREWHDCIKLSCDKGKTLGNETKCNYILSLIG